MRISLETDPAEFVKQVADLRRFLNRQEQKGGQAAMSARMMAAAFVPLLNTLRTELRTEGVEPAQIMTGVADFMLIRFEHTTPKG